MVESLQSEMRSKGSSVRMTGKGAGEWWQWKRGVPVCGRNSGSVSAVSYGVCGVWRRLSGVPRQAFDLLRLTVRAAERVRGRSDRDADQPTTRCSHRTDREHKGTQQTTQDQTRAVILHPWCIVPSCLVMPVSLVRIPVLHVGRLLFCLLPSSRCGPRPTEHQEEKRRGRRGSGAARRKRANDTTNDRRGETQRPVRDSGCIGGLPLSL